MFDLSLPTATEHEIPPFTGPCALEDDDFPFEAISDIATAESWRKEINRPPYHIHKWWAHRLGTVFRAIVLGALTPSGTNVLDAFYRNVRLKGRVVFDPFMGSGTTLGEALKLGADAIGRDINPVAHFLVRNALAIHDRAAVLEAFEDIQRDVAETLGAYYKTELEDGIRADVLYFFWVKQLDCPECRAPVDLFSSTIFARHAYPARHPKAQAVCPSCGAVNEVRFDTRAATCSHCAFTFNPQDGPARGQKATCPACYHRFQIARTVRDSDAPPVHRLYAKLVLTADGKKRYLAATDADRQLYRKASEALADRVDAYPVVAITPGYNTDQALGYNYRYWHEMFNDRQLLCLSILAERIRALRDPVLKELFACLFSGVLEFNNMFASYKGEGTGAVRHMFAHHILKPERVPLEANLWGTSKSSGSFRTMFEGRIRRALDYADNPFELQLASDNGRRATEKVYGISEPLGYEIAESYDEFSDGRRVHLSCGDSGETDIPDRSVDAVITDPPFFDNVHYSQLADFFHVWQRHILGEEGTRRSPTTRSQGEVQNADAAIFAQRLSRVWAEAHRVLADHGVLAFTYHHSRSEGWNAVLHALMAADFVITAALPVKAEMSVAMPKLQAKEPIDLDIVLVCRKRTCLAARRWNGNLWDSVMPIVSGQIRRLRAHGRSLSRNDIRIVVMSQLIRQLSVLPAMEAALHQLERNGPEIESAIERLSLSANDNTSEACP
ncbi:MAG: DNA methyltransferase [Bryobacterales bacterium]|nr:DNA methyltransferase [Bryobacterales bacterium]